MRLTNVACRFKAKLPGGNLWRGKHRLYQKVTPLDAAIQRREYELEEKNMFFLRHPYLSKEESYCHGKALGHREQFYEKMRDVKIKNWRDDLTLGDQLGILKVADKWE